jgi:hypothetical protein
MHGEFISVPLCLRDKNSFKTTVASFWVGPAVAAVGPSP